MVELATWQVQDITFVVTVCPAYRSRFEAVRDTWASRAESVIYLAGSADPELGWTGYDTGDDFASVPARLHHFVLDCAKRGRFEHASSRGTKWWVFVDDDTWVFPERVAASLSLCSAPDEPVLAGAFSRIPERDLEKCMRGDPTSYRDLWIVVGGQSLTLNREALAAIGQYAAANPGYPMNLHGDITLCWLYNQISANRQTIHTSPCSAETLAARGPGSDRATAAHYATPECMRRIFSTWYLPHEHSKAGIRI